MVMLYAQTHLLFSSTDKLMFSVEFHHCSVAPCNQSPVIKVKALLENGGYSDTSKR